MQSVATAGNRKDYAVIAHLRLRFDIDHGVYSHRIHEIDVPSRDRIAISLEDQRSAARFNVAGQRRIVHRALQVYIDSSLHLGQLILDRDVAAALDVYGQSYSADRRGRRVEIMLGEQSKKLLEVAAIGEILDSNIAFEKRRCQVTS